jgi:hypothetical protein
VIIWLKRWLARPPIDVPLEPAPVGVGVGVGATAVVGVGDGLGEGEGLAEGEGVVVGVVVGVGVGQISAPLALTVLVSIGLQDCAAAGTACAPSSTSDVTAVSAAERTKRSARLIMVSARTGCRRHRPAG